VLAMAAGGGYYFVHCAPRAIDSLAVLPLANATSNSEMDYLADGITEGVINQLSRLPRLRVMARSTVFRYRQAQKDPLEIGRELKVGAVIVGRLSQRGDMLSVETEMVDVHNGSQIWGEQYRRRVSDIATVQDDIASDICECFELKKVNEAGLRVALKNGNETRRHPANCGHRAVKKSNTSTDSAKISRVGIPSSEWCYGQSTVSVCADRMQDQQHG